MRIYNAEIVESRNITEYIINLEDFTAYDYKGVDYQKKRKFEELSTREKRMSVLKKEKYYADKRFEIKRIIDCNYTEKSSFLTLTFKENMQDVVKANREFTLFIKRLKRYLKSELKYIATWELQKRGAIHYHVVLFNVPYINSTKLANLWGFGFIKINQVKVNPESVGVYIAKYFSKDLAEKSDYKKAYFCSRNLKKPSHLKRTFEFDIIEKILKDKNLLYVKEFKKFAFDGYDDKCEKIFSSRKYIYVILKKEKEVTSEITSLT